LTTEIDVPFAHGKSAIDGKIMRTDSNLSPVDEDYYSDQEDQDPLCMDESDDTRSLASEDDG
jgi:hypothetical protein